MGMIHLLFLIFSDFFFQTPMNSSKIMQDEIG